MKNTVVIMGSHPRTRAEFDFNRDDCDIWVFNEAISNHTFPRADAVFQMHEEAIWRNPGNRNDPKHAEWLKTQTETVVYMQEQYADVPAAVRFPLAEIIERFHISYFTSSVAYAIALACFHGYKRIEIYGVEMETNTEYQYQRDGVTLWIGVALGMDIEVDLHIGILKDQPLYGYEGEVVIDYHRFEERITELLPSIEQASREHITAKLAADNLLRQFTEDASREAEEKLFASVSSLAAKTEKLGMLDGAKQENERYKKKADDMRTASGEFLFSRQEFESAAKILSDKAEQANTAFISLGTTLGHVHDSIKRTAKGSPKRLALMGEYEKILIMYLKAKNQQAIYRGAAQENFVYMAWLDKHIRAAGGAKSEAVLLESVNNA